MEILTTTMLPMALIRPNNGQIEGLPANPRVLDEKSMRYLVKSIVDNPEMLQLRELLVYRQGGEFIIIGGNMRYRAMCELGYSEAPCKVIPPETNLEQLRAYTIKDNLGYGEWDEEELEGWDAGELEEWGVVMRQKETEEPKVKDTKTLEITLNPEQFKHVKRVLRETDGETDAEALLNLLKNYGRA